MQVMIGLIAKNLKRILPAFLYNGIKIIYKVLKLVFKPLNIFFFKRKIKKVQANHNKALEIVHNKDKINVAFFAIFDSVWKYEDLYALMEGNKKFNPVVFVCPVVNKGKEFMIYNMEKSYNYFKENGYNAIKTYEKETDTYLDIKSSFNPELIFYTNPYKDLIDQRYYIDMFKDKLTCYVPYAIMTTNNKNFYDLDFHNLVWKIFNETKFHIEIGSKIQRRKGENYVFTGYPGLDRLYKGVVKKDPWKDADTNVKRIIWAPHHLINGLDKRSNFLEYSEIFLQIATKYKGRIQFAFKPHPLLKQVLYTLSDWGKTRTDAYYKKWENLVNGQYENGDYFDLFLTSDALIHDCGSFLTEYLITGKPSLFMMSKNLVISDWSEYGLKTLELHYKSQNVSQLIHFIEQVVLKEDDLMKENRIKFVNTILMPPFNKSASENIYDFLISNLY